MGDRRHNNVVRRPGVTAKKRARRARNFVEHKGQWVHCYGPKCGGPGKCSCTQGGPPCFGGCWMLELAKPS